MVMPRRHGFTLIEAVVALTISSVVVVLVSTVFLVQNQYYALQSERSTVHENARAMTDLLATDLRALLEEGVLSAQSKTLAIRVPLGSAAVCATGGNLAVHIDGGPSAIDTGDVDGFAQQTGPTDDWSYFYANWGSISTGGSAAAVLCAANGADTVGSSGEFVSFADLSTFSGVPPAIGDVIVLFALRTYSIGQSQLEPGQIGLFRGDQTGFPIEVATGLDSLARFEYRTGGTSYTAPINGSAMADIDAVRLVAEARKPAVTGGQDDVTFGWDVNVYLRNRR